MSSHRKAKSKKKYRQQERQNERKILKLGSNMRTIDLKGAEEKRKLLVHPFSYPGGRV